MECRHGIVNIRHKITGCLEINGCMKDFHDGVGYIEKDWGRSFPTSWIWLQSHDDTNNATFMFSMADIPFLGSRFLGVLCFLYKDGKYSSVSTYNGAKITDYRLYESKVFIALSNRKYIVSLDINRARGGTLMAPAKGMMNRTIEETLNASASIRFLHKNGKAVYRGTGENAGLEICGNVPALFKKYLKF
jgi:hypothetical protein